MTSDPWLELEGVVEPGPMFARFSPGVYPDYPITVRAIRALMKLGWQTPDAVVCGDVKRLMAVVGTGHVTWGEIARMRRKIMEARDEQGGG